MFDYELYRQKIKVVIQVTLLYCRLIRFGLRIRGAYKHPEMTYWLRSGCFLVFAGRTGPILAIVGRLT